MAKAIKEDLIEGLPQSGEVDYETLRQSLISAGKAKSLAFFHEMRRKKEIIVRLDVSDGTAKLFVKRVAG